MKTQTMLRFNRLLAGIIAATMLLSAVSLAAPRRSSSPRSSGPVHVKSYTKKDGTTVRAHDRSAPKSEGSDSKASPSAKAVVPHGRSDSKAGPRSNAGASDYGNSTRSPLGATHPIGSPTRKASPHFASGAVGGRDEHGRIERSAAAKGEFMRQTGYPHGRPGYVVDHITALKRGGTDSPTNMQWQTVEQAKRKDKWE